MNTREDRFLGGRVRIHQPTEGYRAATDPVLLAAAVPARAGDSVLDLGCGAGTAVLCLMARVAGLSAAGLDVQPAYAGLARQNAAANGVDLTVIEGDLLAMPAALRERRFDHVMMNPPYHAATDLAARDAGRDVAHREGAAGLGDWIDAGLRRVVPRGTITIIHRAERLPAILGHLEARAGGVTVLPLAPRAGREAGRVIVRARTSVRTPFRLLAPLILHAGPAHLADREDFTDTAIGILRHGNAIGLASSLD